MKHTHTIERDKFIISKIHLCPADYLEEKSREDFFELLWFSYKDSVSGADNSQYIYLIPQYRFSNISFEDKEGYLIAFKREYLEEDDKEYALDVFNLFNMQGQYSILPSGPEINSIFHHLFLLLALEFENPAGTYLIVKSLLKVILLHLIRQNKNGYITQDLDQKRVYHFMSLMDQFYQTQRKADFYSSQLNISEKRLNQILKNKLGKTITQLIHARLILEAKRKIISSEETIKEIAFSLNFEDRGYFTRFFKKQTGYTPEDFKKRHS